MLTGSKSSTTNNSKKTLSSSSSKKSTLSSSRKAPSVSSKKKSARSKAKEQTLSRYAWLYVGILFAVMIVPLILRNHLIMQSVSAFCMWVGVYLLGTVVDLIVVSSPK